MRSPPLRIDRCGALPLPPPRVVNKARARPIVQAHAEHACCAVAAWSCGAPVPRETDRRAQAQPGRRRKAPIMITMPRCLAFLVVLALASGTTVAAPVLNVSRTLLDFGNVTFGVPAGTQSFDVTNVGDAPLALTGFGLIGSQSFALGGPCDSVFTLNPGASCRFDITLTVPNQVAGTIAARIDIDSNGGPTAQVQLRAFSTGAGGAPRHRPQPARSDRIVVPAVDRRTGDEIEVCKSGCSWNRVSAERWFTHYTAPGVPALVCLQRNVQTGQTSAAARALSERPAQRVAVTSAVRSARRAQRRRCVTARWLTPSRRYVRARSRSCASRRTSPARPAARLRATRISVTRAIGSIRRHQVKDSCSR